MSILLSVIVPFRKRSGDAGSVRRLDQAVGCFAGLANVEVVVYDTGSQSARPLLENQHQDNLCYFHQSIPGVFAPGRVRNLALACATGQYVFLFDADLLISRSVAEACCSRCIS